MREAIAQAQTAFDLGEVPVGAVVVQRNTIVGTGHNRMVASGQPFEHAEVRAMGDAVATLGRRTLDDCALYVTIEPCVMCIGAVILARVPRVVFGAREPRTGACESIFSIPNEPALEHRIAVTGGVEHERCRDLMQRFFAQQRA